MRAREKKETKEYARAHGASLNIYIEAWRTKFLNTTKLTIALCSLANHAIFLVECDFVIFCRTFWKFVNINFKKKSWLLMNRDLEAYDKVNELKFVLFSNGKYSLLLVLLRGMSAHKLT